MSDIAQIVKGEDRVLTLSIKVKRREGDPYDLTGWTEIIAEFRKSDMSILSLSTAGVFATTSHTNGTDTVIFTADTIGVVGNSISLVFDGIDDVATVVGAWNTANPGNTVSHDGAGTEVLPAATVNLADGLDPLTQVSILGDEVLGKIQVSLTDEHTSSLRLGKSQSIRVKIDKGTQRRIAIFRNSIDVVNPQF